MLQKLYVFKKKTFFKGKYVLYSVFKAGSESMNIKWPQTTQEAMKWNMLTNEIPHWKIEKNANFVRDRLQIVFPKEIEDEE